MCDGKQARLMALLVSSAYLIFIVAGVSRLRTRRGGNENRRMSAIAPSTPSGAHSCYLDFVGSFYFGCSFTVQLCRSDQPGNRPPLFPARNCSGGGSPEGAEVQTRTLFSPLWALFGYFLARQKVTTSPPQRRREQRQKSRKKKQTHHAQKRGKSTEGKSFLHASDCNRAASML